MQSAVNLALARVVTQSSVLVDLVHISSKDEHIFLANFLSNFNISTVHCTDDKRTIHDKLHVGGARGLSAGSGDVLRQIGCGYDDLGVGDAVVLEEDNFEQVVDGSVVVDYLPD